MLISKTHRTNIGWIAVSAITFALGWHLNSSPRDEQATAITSVTVAETLVPGHREGSPQNSDKGTDANGSIDHRSLNSSQISAIGERLRRATDPITRREAFAELLAGLTAENALEIREQIAHLKADDPEFRDFHYAWGKVGGLDAVLHGLETDQRDMGPTLAGWASADPESAMEWYETLENEGNGGANKQAMKAALVHGLAIADPGNAADFVYALGEAGDRRAKEMMGIVMGRVVQSGGAQEAAQWASNLRDGELRGHALWEAGRAGVRENPDGTLAWASALAQDDPNAGNLAYGIAQEMGWRDGPKVAEWLNSLDSEAVTSAYGPLLGGWTKADPLAASQFVADMPPSEPRDWAIAAEAYIHKDPAGAADWLPTSGLPVETQQRLVQSVQDKE